MFRCLEVLCLQQVLCKKRDAVSHNLFFEILLGSGSSSSGDRRANVLRRFFSGAVASVRERLSAAAAESNFLKQALEGEYPKLLRLFGDLWSRLHQAGAGLRVEGSAAPPSSSDGGGVGGLRNPLASRAMDAELRETLMDLERFVV